MRDLLGLPGATLDAIRDALEHPLWVGASDQDIAELACPEGTPPRAVRAVRAAMARDARQGALAAQLGELRAAVGWTGADADLVALCVRWVLHDLRRELGSADKMTSPRGYDEQPTGSDGGKGSRGVKDPECGRVARRGWEPAPASAQAGVPVSEAATGSAHLGHTGIARRPGER